MGRKTKIHIADTYCREILSKYPDSLDMADGFRRKRARYGAAYPDWCDLPSSLAALIITGIVDDEAVLLQRLKQLPKNAVIDLTTALTWISGKMIYHFDGTLADALTAQPLDGNIPSEALNFMPYPCVYIDRRINFEGFETIGFFAWLDWVHSDLEKHLRLQFLCKNSDAVRVFMPLTGGTIDDNIAEIFCPSRNPTGQPNFGDMRLDSMFPKLLAACINLLLYICSEKPDMPDDSELRQRRSRDSRGIPKRAARWDVGTRIGAAIRKAEDVQLTSNEAGKHKFPISRPPYSSPRPHLRRAHWHSFWMGKKDSAERKLVLRWLPPIPVNIDGTDLPAVVSKIKE
jgi:hypothetical protein